MKLLLVGVGRLKAGPERELFVRYAERCGPLGKKIGFSAFEWRETDESRARRPDDRRAEEAAAIMACLPSGARKIGLDERGEKNLSSENFAARLGHWRDEGFGCCALVIGGPDGLHSTLREKCDLVLAFGALTLPHQLVRVLASEQIFRAMTILAGHPYHRP